MKENSEENQSGRIDTGWEDEKSLYDCISSAVVDGELPEKFSLPDNAGENGVQWMDGARDGVIIYHTAWHKITEEESTLMKEAVQAASFWENKDKANDLFCRLGQKVRAISIIDALQSYVVENKDELSAENLYYYAIHTIVESADRECVKFALSLLELFQTNSNEAVKSVVRTLGLSDEFSIFALFIMNQWKNGNDEIFELARKTHGWGRIHAIERLEPEKNEIKQWLLREGVHNKVLSSYSALICWQKSDAENVLNGDLCREDFSGIRDIIEGLLDEGPCTGISAIENGVDIIITFLDKAKKMKLVLEDYETIRNICNYYQEDNSDITVRCRDLLTSKDCKSLVRTAVKKGKSLELAQELKIEYHEDILRLLETEFDEKYFLCSYLIEDSRYRQKVLQIFEQKLPLEEMKTLPTKNLGLGKVYQKQQQLQCIVQLLGSYPLEGMTLIETALQCAPTTTRNRGLGILETWTSNRQIPLEKLLPDIFTLLVQLREIEVDDDVRERMNKLIEGKL